MADWEAEGLLEGQEGRQRQARVALLDMLEAEGFELDDIKRSHGEGELLFLLTSRAIGVSSEYTWRELLDRAEMPEDLVERLIRAQGLTRADENERAYGDADVGLLRATKEILEAGVAEDDAIAVGRLLGRGFSQAAEVMRGTAMRIVLEPGLDERELAVRYAHAAGALAPMVEPLLGSMLKLHLSKLVQTELLSAEEREAGVLAGARHVTVTFADLVGFTRLGEQVPPDELGAVAARLEQMVLDLVEPPVRFVKTIGDAVMLVSPEPEPMLDTALRMVAAADAEGESFPQLRTGLAAGEALSRTGDWFGRPVNLASRVTAVAYPGSVLATDSVQTMAPAAYRWSKAGVRHLKGIPDAVPLWRARPLEPETA
jgi:adenylate cyclase